MLNHNQPQSNQKLLQLKSYQVENKIINIERGFGYKQTRIEST